MHWCTVAQHVKKKWESLEKLDWNTAGFIGPILLNCVVSFMENPDPDSGMVTGYIYIRHSTRHLFLHWSFVFLSLQLVHDRARR